MITECLRCLFVTKCAKLMGGMDLVKCEDFTEYRDYRKVEHGTWNYYSTTMMECSVCGRHTARHRFEFCPHCGAAMMMSKVQLKQDSPDNWPQLSLFDNHTGGHNQ